MRKAFARVSSATLNDISMNPLNSARVVIMDVACQNVASKRFNSTDLLPFRQRAAILHFVGGKDASQPAAELYRRGCPHGLDPQGRGPPECRGVRDQSSDSGAGNPVGNADLPTPAQEADPHG